MKHLLKFLCGVAMVPLLTMSLAGCSDDDFSDGKNNPNYNPATNEVTAQFVFNVSLANTASTRMSADNVQADVGYEDNGSVTSGKNAFRGMDHVYINALVQNSNGQHLFDVNSTTEFNRVYDLSALLTKDEIRQNKSHRVVEMALPMGTNTIVFYGKATKSNSSTANAEQGSITMNVEKNVNNIWFREDTRLTNKTVFDQSADLLATILTRIVRNGLHQETSGDPQGNKITRDMRQTFFWNDQLYAVNDMQGVVNGETVTFTYKDDNRTSYPYGYYTYTSSDNTTTIREAFIDSSKQGINGYQHSVSSTYYGQFDYYKEVTQEWYDYGKQFETDRTQMVPLEEILGEAYYQFTHKKSDAEIRAGSAQAILYQVRDLWALTDKVANATPTNAREHIAKLLAKRIETRFSTYFNGSVSENNIEYKSIEQLKSQIDTYVSGKTNAYSALTSKIDNFPTDLNLPMGAAQVKYTDETSSGENAVILPTFSYETALPTYGMTGVSGTTSTIDKYVYPAELMYFGNSPIRVSNQEHSPSEYPDTVADWDTDNKWTEDWVKNSHVESSTRSIAMQQDINYGTALLKSTVRYNKGILYDNNFALNSPSANNEINVSTGSTFQLTGIVIGGQTAQVGWNFVRKENAEIEGTTPNYGSFDFMVYDSHIPNNGLIDAFTGSEETAKSNAQSKPVYTLLWDNYNETLALDQQTAVYVALEFKNLGSGFWGAANYIRSGGTFYIIGKLDPKEQKEVDDGEGGTKKENKYSYPTRDKVNYAQPPYYATSDTDKPTGKSAGDTKEAVRVFMQDHVTVADFVIGETSLQHAYVTVPDLRTSQVSLGLSVDVHWETGLEFNDVILGEDPGSGS